MQPPADHPIVYKDNVAYGGTNHYGNSYTNVHNYSKPDPDQCLRDMRLTDPREDKARIEKDKDRLLKQCYSWILEDASFQRWRAEGDTRVLWIKGDPGKGKTMMIMGIIDELASKRELNNTTWEKLTKFKRPSRSCLLAYFFCQSTRPELNNAASVLRGLIYLLVDKKKELRRHVQKRYQAAGSKLFEGLNTVFALRGILSDILHDPILPMTYLLVDALDECTSGLDELVRIITDDTLAPRSTVKWLVTSRNLPSIQQFLNPLSDKVSLELNASHISKAVLAFINFKVQSLAAVQNDPKLRKEVQQVLCNGAEDTFLWVSLVCKELETVEHYRVREVLRELPPGLDPLYKRMMEHILTQKRIQTIQFCKAILQSVMLACRPLQLQEIVVAAGLPKDQFQDIQGVIDLVSRCGSFLTIRDSTLFFVHLSARDYFTSGNGQQMLEGTVAAQHRRMADRLLDVMDSTLRKDMCSLQKPGTLIEETLSRIEHSVLPEIAYACEYWVEHLSACLQDSHNVLLDDGKAHRFLQEHLLHWIEAMGLLKKIPDAIAAIQKLQSILAKSNSKILSRLVHDMLRFLMWSGAVIQKAPLQIYYSALLFAPEESLIRKRFKQETPNWIKVRSGVDRVWGALLQTLEGHTMSATDVAFSPQGDRLVSASPNEIQLWDANTGLPLQRFEGHASWITRVAFSLQGDRLASTSSKTVRLWDANTCRPLQTLEGHTSAVRSVAFSPQGDRLASASDDKTIRLWDANTGLPLQTLEGHTGPVRSVAFSPQGDRLASASDDKTIQLWDANTGLPLQTLEGHTMSATDVAFSPQGDRLASASDDKTIRLWDANTGLPLQTLKGHTAAVLSVTFSLQGDRLASASWKTVRLWDATTGRPLQTLKSHTHWVWSVAFSPQGDRLASASADITIRLWDVTTDPPFQMLEGHTSFVGSVALSPQGDRLASASDDTTVRLWDVTTGLLLQTLKSHTSAVRSVAFSPQGDRLASASDDKTIQLWDANTGRPLQTLKGHTSAVMSVAFSLQGDRLASASWKTVWLWDATTGRPLRTLKGHTDWVMSVAFSPQRDRLASASDDNTIRLWDANTGLLLLTLEGYTGLRISVAFSPQGDRLASASYNTIQLWDANTGLLLQTLEGYPGLTEASNIFQDAYRRGQWVLFQTEGVLLLPSQHQVQCSATYGKVVALGTASGRLLVLSFST